MHHEFNFVDDFGNQISWTLGFLACGSLCAFGFQVENYIFGMLEEI